MPLRAGPWSGGGFSTRLGWRGIATSPVLVSPAILAAVMGCAAGVAVAVGSGVLLGASVGVADGTSVGAEVAVSGSVGGTTALGGAAVGWGGEHVRKIQAEPNNHPSEGLTTF